MSTVTPLAGSPDAALVAEDLRALADLVENDGDGFLAALIRQLFAKSAVWPLHSVAYDDRDDSGREVMAETIRRFKAIATAPVRKEYEDGGDGYFNATIPLRALRIKLTDLRARVCERVVTGTTTVTEEIPDPEYVAAAPKVAVTRTVESVEWKCVPILADAEAVQS